MPVMTEEEVTITRATFQKDELVDLFVKNTGILNDYGTLDDNYKYTFRVFDSTGKKVCDDVANVTIIRVRERSI
tara:strand:+ start:2906 stop:3127 length:222 start_codon:yes stop_codon:yes gene_type:complete